LLRVLKINIYMVHQSDCAGFNEVYKELMGAPASNTNLKCHLILTGVDDARPKASSGLRVRCRTIWRCSRRDGMYRSSAARKLVYTEPRLEVPSIICCTALTLVWCGCLCQQSAPRTCSGERRMGSGSGRPKKRSSLGRQSWIRSGSLTTSRINPEFCNLRLPSPASNQS
jgi:hypothetical protein